MSTRLIQSWKHRYSGGQNLKGLEWNQWAEKGFLWPLSKIQADGASKLLRDGKKWTMSMENVPSWIVVTLFHPASITAHEGKSPSTVVANANCIPHVASAFSWTYEHDVLFLLICWTILGVGTPHFWIVVLGQSPRVGVAVAADNLAHRKLGLVERPFDDGELIVPKSHLKHLRHFEVTSCPQA